MVVKIKGNGSLYKTKGSWVYEIRYVDENDKSRRKVFTNPLKSVVIKQRDEFLEEVKKCTCVFSDKTVKEFFEFYLETTSRGFIKDTSHIRKLSVLKNQILPGIGEVKMRNLNTIIVQELINQLHKDGYSTSTIKKVLILLNSGIEYFRGVGGECQYSSAMINIPADEEKEPTFFNEEETLIIEEYLNEHSGERYSYALLILLHTGMRVGELIALKWSSVDLQNRTLMITENASEISLDENDAVKYGIKNVKPKTPSGVRRLLLDSTVIAALEKLKERDKDIGSEYIICTQTGKQVFKGEINRYFHKAIKRAGIEKQGDCGPHSLRHTFATRMIAKGISPQTLAVYLGHSTDQITRKYYVHDKQSIAEAELRKSGLFA